MKKLLVDEMRTQRSMSEADASRAVDDVFGAVSRVLARGERVAIQGFGTFSRKFQDTRTARNPRTGESVTVQGRHVTKFKEARQRER